MRASMSRTASPTPSCRGKIHEGHRSGRRRRRRHLGLVSRRGGARSRAGRSPAGAGARNQLRQCGRRSEEHTSELQSLMRISYAVFCLKKKKKEKMTQESKTTTQTHKK